MPKILNNIKVGLDEDLEEKLAWLEPNYSHYNITRKSVDARKKPHFVYSFEVYGEKEEFKPKSFNLEQHQLPKSTAAPLIVGSGPAGLFAALRFVEQGIPCHIFEQGSETGKRLLKITRFWRHGEFDSNDNVCFGEGGAGLFSDGKLITRIKSPHIPYVMNRLVQFGAPEEIEYLANPHVGSDRIRRLIPKIREHIKKLGGTFHFNTKVTELLFENKNVVGLKTDKGEEFRSDHVLLANGHSTRDMFEHLNSNGVFIEGKSFAVGLRIEHSQEHLNQIQYGKHADHPKLGSANYKITHHNKETGVGVYSFCMCPGGYVLSSGTESSGIVCNGMSNYNRNAPFANAAIVVSIDHKKSFKDNLFGGFEFQHALEKQAYDEVQAKGGGHKLPAQKLSDFIAERETKELSKFSSPSGAVPVRLDQMLPSNLKTPLIEALHNFDRKMKGFVYEGAQLFGVETRTSSPLRITRDESFQSITHKGLYPAGEGAGYAGGITSAACDGIKIADSIVASYTSQSSNKTL